MFELPEGGLAPLTDGELADLEQQGMAAFDDLDISVDSDEDTIAAGEAIAEAVREVRSEIRVRTERREKAERLIDEMTPVEVSEPEDTTEEEPEAEAEDTTEEPEAEAEVEPSEEDIAEVVAEAEQITEDAPEPVVASADETPAERAARNATPPTMKEKRVNVITAAADTGFPAGAELDSLTAAAGAFTKRMGGISKGAGKYKQTANVFSVGLDPEFSLKGNEPVEQVDQVLADAVASRLYMPAEGALTAAAGWASPSETMYDLCQYEQAVNLLSLPEVGVSRGGLRFTREPSFATIYSGVGFDLTEAQVIADTSKSSYDVPTPAFVDVRLDAVGFVLRAGILQNAAYPELVRRVLEGALVAHQYKVNAKMIAAIATAATAAPAVVEEGAFYSNLEALAFVARSIRQQFRLPDSHVINAVLALWVQDSFKADIARRTGRPSASVSDAEVREWFTTRGINAQFVYGVDELDLSSNVQVKGKATTPVHMYPEGTFVKLMAPVIDLSAVYDSTLLDTNEYTAAFVEQGVELAHRCLDAWTVTLNVTATGMTAANTLDQPHGTVEA